MYVIIFALRKTERELIRWNYFVTRLLFKVISSEYVVTTVKNALEKLLEGWTHLCQVSFKTSRPVQLPCTARLRFARLYTGRDYFSPSAAFDKLKNLALPFAEETERHT